VGQVLSALLHLHRDLRVVHRDLKPTNLLLDRTGAMKLSDFGVSGQLENSMSQCASWVRRRLWPQGGAERQTRRFKHRCRHCNAGCTTVHDLATADSIPVRIDSCANRITVGTGSPFMP